MTLNPKQLNEMVKRRLDGNSPHLMTPRPNWASEFVKLPDDAVSSMMGSGGESLHQLLAAMDTDHPDLEACLEEKLFGNHPMPPFFAVIGLASLAVEHGRTDLLPPLACIKLLPDSITTAIKPFVRCLRDPAMREEHRRTKKPQVIDMSTVARKGEELWNTQPASFDALIRYEDAYAGEIAAANRRANRFRSLGCTAMYSEVMKTVEAFQSQVADSYSGFNRLTFNAACVILAKWHNYNLVTPFILSDFPPERNYKVVVEPKQFRKMKSDFFTRPDESDMSWPYSPRVYPLYEMEPLPPDVTEIVGLCENYHGFGGKPLFDHYAVMVPGIDYPPCRDGQYSFRTESGEVRSFEDQNEARFALDKMLLGAGVFSAVVMGERDGKCYCLSVWS